MSSSTSEDVLPFPRARKSSNASVVSDGSPASLRKQRQSMAGFGGSSSNLSLPLLFIKEKLQWTVFSAEYKERRYMDFLTSYRDVLVIDAAEKAVIKIFKEVIKHCKKEMDEDVWIGIKKSSDSVALFVELPDGQPFGRYWFLVRSVKYRSSDGLELRIRSLREVCPTDTSSAADRATPGRPVSEWSRDDLLRWVSTTLAALPWADWAAMLRQICSVDTVREVARFVTVCCLFLLSCFKDAHIWLLRFIDAAGMFVQRCTPLATAVLQFCLKVIGGMYILLARVWADLRHGPPPPAARSSAKQRLRLGPPPPPPAWQQSLTPPPPPPAWQQSLTPPPPPPVWQPPRWTAPSSPPRGGCQPDVSGCPLVMRRARPISR